MSLFNRAANLIWAMEPGALDMMMSVLARSNLDPEAAKAIWEERQKRFEADLNGVDFGVVQAKPGERISGTKLARQRDPQIGVLPVIGPIVRRADFFSEISGATSIETLAKDFNSLLANDEIKSIVLYFDSPGGA